MREIKDAILSMSDALRASRELNEQLTIEVIQARAKINEMQLILLKKEIPKDESANASSSEYDESGVMYQ
jgi:citrate synthase